MEMEKEEPIQQMEGEKIWRDSAAGVIVALGIVVNLFETDS